MFGPRLSRKLLDDDTADRSCGDGLETAIGVENRPITQIQAKNLSGIKPMLEKEDDLKTRIINEIWQLMVHLSGRNDALLRPSLSISRVELNDLYRVMDESGQTLQAPPFQAFKASDVLEIDEHMFRCDANLWNDKNHMTDLTVNLTIHVEGIAISIEIDDLRVM